MQTPCALCPKGDRSNWESVGCKRGDFKSKHIPVRLCPASSKNTFERFEDRLISLQDPKAVATSLQNSLGRRTLWVSQNAHLASSTGSVRGDEILHTFRQNLPTTSPSSPLNELLLSTTLTPLLQCMLDIEWELIENSSSGVICKTVESFDRLASLLPPASTYQAELDSVRWLSPYSSSKLWKLIVKNLGPTNCPVTNLFACLSRSTPSEAVRLSRKVASHWLQWCQLSFWMFQFRHPYWYIPAGAL